MKGESERSRRSPQLGGARLPKGCTCHRRKSAGTIESMGWVEERAEPWRSARPRLGASTGLIHHVGWCRSVSPEKMAAFREPHPTKLGPSRRPFTFHTFPNALDRRDILYSVPCLDGDC